MESPARPGVGVVEAGYGAIGAYWQLPRILDDGGTSFQTMQFRVRHDVSVHRDAVPV
jgi:hypothetical protein